MGISAGCSTPESRSKAVEAFIRIGGVKVEAGQRIDVSGLTPDERQALYNRAQSHPDRKPWDTPVSYERPLIPVGDGTHTLDTDPSHAVLVIRMEPGAYIRPPLGAGRGKR